MNVERAIPVASEEATRVLRCDLGKQLGLDIGEPEQRAVGAYNNVVRVRDELGMLLDPHRYASSRCNVCYGRGVVTTLFPVSAEEAEKFLAQHPEMEGMFFKKAEGGYSTRQVQMCHCASTRYAKQKQAFGVLLTSHRLVRWVDGAYKLVNSAPLCDNRDTKE